MKIPSHWIWWAGAALFAPGFFTWISISVFALFQDMLNLPPFDRSGIAGVYLPMLAAIVGFTIPLLCVRWFRRASWRINGVAFGIYLAAMLTWGILDIRNENYQYGGHDYPNGLSDGHRHYTHSYWTWYFLPYRWIE